MRGTPAAGDRIDVAPVTGPTDIFQVVQDAVNALRSGTAGNGAALSQDIARAMTELDAGLDRVLLARGRAGEWLNRSDSLNGLMEDRSVDLKTEKAKLEELDMVQGLSDFKTMEVGLEAAIKSYAQVQRLSLFSVI
jgi:flagellar hook-associated protein 3 FlgL